MLIVLTGLCLQCGFEFFSLFCSKVDTWHSFWVQNWFGATLEPDKRIFRLPGQVKGFHKCTGWNVLFVCSPNLTWECQRPEQWELPCFETVFNLNTSYHLPWGFLWLVSFAILSCSRLKIFIGLQGRIFGILWKPGRYQTLSNDMIIKWFAEITLSIIQYIPCSQGSVSYS